MTRKSMAMIISDQTGYAWANSSCPSALRLATVTPSQRAASRPLSTVRPEMTPATPRPKMTRPFSDHQFARPQPTQGPRRVGRDPQRRRVGGGAGDHAQLAAVLGSAGVARTDRHGVPKVEELAAQRLGDLSRADDADVHVDLCLL